MRRHNMGQKVYVVTTGEYSDYHIERVFLNRAKAETYAQIVRETDDYWYANSVCVNEYDTSDDIIISKRWCVDFRYFIPDSNVTGGLYYYHIDIEPYVEEDNHIRHCTRYYGNMIELKRTLNSNPGDADKEKLAAKYLKICEDLYAKIEYELANGADECDVLLMFDNGAIKAIDDEEECAEQG